MNKKKSYIISYITYSQKIQKISNMNLNTFSGKKDAFEFVLKEEHEIDGKTDGGMYSYKGLRQYGNIVSLKPTLKTLDILSKCSWWSTEFVNKLIDWYGAKQSIDTFILKEYIEMWKNPEYEK